MSRLREVGDLLNSSKPDARFGALVGVWLALMLGAVNIRVIHNDNVPNVLIPVSLLREGNVELSEFTPVLESEPEGERYWAVNSQQGLYSKYPIWTGVMATPFFVLLAWWDSLLVNDRVWLVIGRLVSLAISGVFAGVMVTALRNWMSACWAIILTVFAIFGSSLWHHLGSHLTNQTLPILCVAIILSLLKQTKINRTKAVAIGLISGLMATARLPCIFTAGLPLGVFLTRSQWRKFIPWVVLGGLIFPAMTLVYQNHAFGGPFTTGYSFYETEKFDSPMLEGLLGLAFSPTCGLFFYSPFLLIGLYFAFPSLRGKTGQTTDYLNLWIFLGFVGQWFLFSKWYCWNGALIFGARMMAETVPGFLFLIGLAWPVIAKSTFAKRVLLITGVLAVLHHLAGTVTYDIIAPTDPMKSNWNFMQDFIVLYVKQRGVGMLLWRILLHGAILTGTFLLAGYLASRFLVPKSDSKKQTADPVR